MKKSHHVHDLKGRVFSRLTVESFAESRKGNAYWNCVCDCGNKKVVSAINLKNGNVKSCGCLAKENGKKYAIKNLQSEENKKKASEKFMEKNVVDGVLVPSITRKIASDNKSGVKGVCFVKARNKWVATISVDGKQLQLGRFDTFEEAVKVRKKAEEKYYKPILDKAKTQPLD